MAPTGDVAEAVATAAGVLRKVWPDWHNEVALDRLDIGRTDCCVLAQLAERHGLTTPGASPFASGMIHLLQTPAWMSMREEVVEEVQAALHNSDVLEYPREEVQEAWEQLIRRRNRQAVTA